MASRCEDHTAGAQAPRGNGERRGSASLPGDGYRCTVQVRPGERCEGTKLLEIHHRDGGGDVLLVPDDELRTVCRKHNPRGG